jgi:hypothetical protein
MQIKRFEAYKAEVASYNSRYSRTFETIKYEVDPDAHLNEGFLGTIFGALGGGFKDTLVSFFVDWGLKKLGAGEGYDAEGQPTFIRQLLQNAAESIEITEITTYFKGGACGKWTKLFQDALLKTITEDFIRRMLVGFGLKIDLSTGIGATIVKTLLNSISNAIVSTEFVTNLEKFLADKICNVKFGDLLSGLGSSEKEKVSGAAAEYVEKNPEKGEKMVDKFGLSKLLSNFGSEPSLA